MGRLKSLYVTLLTLGLLIGALIGAYALRAQWLPAMGRLLMADESNPLQADVMILLMGDVAARTPHAARLLLQGAAPQIVITQVEDNPLVEIGYQVNDTKATASYLTRLGVPPERLRIINDIQATSTIEEAKAILADLSKQNPHPRRLLLVTSWYHTARAQWIFNRVNQQGFEIRVSAAQSPLSNPDMWWQKERTFLDVFNEYLKWLYYLINY